MTKKIWAWTIRLAYHDEESGGDLGRRWLVWRNAAREADEIWTWTNRMAYRGEVNVKEPGRAVRVPHSGEVNVKGAG